MLRANSSRVFFARIVPVILCGSVSFSPLWSAEPSGSGGSSGKLLYNRDIRPILADHCFACHGPDSAARKADLRLDQFQAAVDAGALKPGNPDESEMLRRVELPENDEGAMPPSTGHKRLTPEQKATLRQWIAAGAEYQPHWSLIVPQRSALPSVQDAAWVRNPIDQFILAELEQRGLKPAPEADRATLARRAALDVTGLPPDPKDVAAFVNDPSPNAYEQYVERLLDSPRWGEHRARFWLDYARYADTHGIHFDNYREVWAFRDWVIDAFNRNLPFDQFTIEQLAGDLLPQPNMDQLIATGFNRCNITTNEGGIIDEEYKVLYARDRTETLATVWLGASAGCAVCHDHKFDPWTMRDFYSLSAFFNNTTQPVRDGNTHNTPPIITVPRKEDRDRWNALEGEIGAAKQAVEMQRAAARQAFEAAGSNVDFLSLQQSLPQDGLKAHALLAEGAGPSTAVAVDGRLRLVSSPQPLQWGEGHTGPSSLAAQGAMALEMPDVGDFEADQGFSYGAWIWLPKGRHSGAVFARMDDRNGFPGWDLWMENNRIGAHIINRHPDPGKWLKVVSRAELAVEKWQHVFITYDGSRKAAGLKIYVDGQLRTDRDEPGASLEGSIHTEVPLKIGRRHTSAALEGVRIQDLRIYSRTLNDDEARRLASTTRVAWLASRGGAKTPAEIDELFQWWLPDHSPEHRAAAEKLASLEGEREAIRGRGTIAHVMTERAEEAEAYILNRGEYDQRRDRVTAATPQTLPPYPADYPRNRLGLARWLLLPEQPLTARVTVNRFWQEVFGTGLVATSGDFGVTGQLPSHPELLDWLAIEFREKGWNIKDLFRLMLLSNTYRQSAEATLAKLEADPQNRLLTRGPRYRMDAEMVRDYALAAGGLLSPKVGGASAKPYQPEGVWEAVAMIGSNTRNYVADKGENLYRRSMYTFWKRSAPPASMDILNAPSRETCTVRRERTNTPLQALVTLNDPQFIEAARNLAGTAIKAGDPIDLRLDVIAQRVLARGLKPAEQQLLASSTQELLTFYQAHPDEAKQLVTVGETPLDASLPVPELAAYTLVVNQLLNLDEVLNK